MGKGQNSVLDGTDLILSVEDVALGFSSNCKINTQAETGERLTKEARGGKWKQKYIKGFSEDISAEGCILTDGGEGMPTYDQLKDMMLRGEPVTAQYSVRDGDKRTGKTAGGYRGEYLITSLEGTGQVGEDAKYSIKLENCGPVEKIDGGFTETQASGVNIDNDN